jgi:hypothetical protein
MPRSKVVTAIGAAVAVAVVAILLLLRGDTGGSPTPGDPAPAPTSTGTAPTAPDAAAGGGDGGEGQAAAEDRSRPDGAGVEVLPDERSEPGGAGSGAAARVPGPRGGAAAGDGPRRVVTPAPRSVVGSHERSTDGRAVQVALTAENRSSGTFVLRYYRTRLARMAFREVRVPAVGGSSVAAFRKGRESVTVTVTPRPAGGVTYSVLGILRPGRS